MDVIRLPALVLLLAPGLVSAQVDLAQGGESPTEAVSHQSAPGPVVRFGFDGSIEDASGGPVAVTEGRAPSYVEGLEGQALRLGPGDAAAFLTMSSGLPSLDPGRDFSVRFWVRSDADPARRFVLLSKKELADNSLESQKSAGWVFYSSHGTWAWSVGSGSRRLTYERDNGHRMPLNDGRWHQLAMTYSAQRSVIRLFFDGVNWVSYHVADSEGFDFTSPSPATVGWDGGDGSAVGDLLPAIESGAERLQAFVDAFNDLGQRPIESDEFLRLIVDPRGMYEQRAAQGIEDEAWRSVAAAEAALMENPYTIHQALEFMEAAPLTKIYALVDGRVVIRRDVAARYAAREQLSTPDFAIDDLALWDRVLSPEEVRSSYAEHFEPTDAALASEVATLTAAAWNIWHGGKHFTTQEHGWDSRVRVAEMLEDAGVDVVMMQETYSSGDFIAAELGYYFATTVDLDYLNQGANISVLSRYPIRELHVEEGSAFNNVGAKVALSATQDIHVMSNWYGMNQFPVVFDFHRFRFAESDSMPVLFGGDFNAVPHTDGGNSPASRALLDAGFTDAFRSLHPDLERWPGPTHRSGRRIDQLYYKGSGLTNTSTRVISTRERGFPSDHFLILSRFDLDYRTRETGRLP
jgi:endonuclease/exonuclease/phosphatase family metal-dependent hydrolase